MSAEDESVSPMQPGFQPSKFVGVVETYREGETLVQSLQRLLDGNTWSDTKKPQAIVRSVATSYGFSIAVKGNDGRYLRCSRSGDKQRNYKSKHVREIPSQCCQCPFVVKLSVQKRRLGPPAQEDAVRVLEINAVHNHPIGPGELAMTKARSGKLLSLSEDRWLSLCGVAISNGTTAQWRDTLRQLLPKRTSISAARIRSFRNKVRKMLPVFHETGSLTQYLFENRDDLHVGGADEYVEDIVGVEGDGAVAAYLDILSQDLNESVWKVGPEDTVELGIKIWTQALRFLPEGPLSPTRMQGSGRLLRLSPS
eukprot:scaffold2330_cov404-Pinguiococcus_pyrenoidosus.AAC.2